MNTVIENFFELNPASEVKTVKLVLYNQPTVDVFSNIWQNKWEHQL
jgi:hypothetical protein